MPSTVLWEHLKTYTSKSCFFMNSILRSLTSVELPGDEAVPFTGDPFGVTDFVGELTLAPAVCALATSDGGNRVAHEGPVAPSDWPASPDMSSDSSSSEFTVKFKE